MNRLLYIILIFLFACQNSSLKIEHGISKKLADWRFQQIYNITYQLEFNIPENESVNVSGKVNAVFSLNKNSENLQFDFRGEGSVVHTVVANSDTIGVQWKHDHIIIPFQYLREGENNVEIEFISSNQSLNRNEEFLYTLFVPDRASTVFPCFDQPNLKAKFQLSLTVPAIWKAVANAPVKTLMEQDSVSVYQFNATKPIPTYLFAFVAGNFQVETAMHNNNEYHLFHREPDAVKIDKNLPEIWELLFSSLDSIETYTQIKYPFSKYNLVAIPSFQYGGMEHPGVTLYKSSLMFLDDNPSRRQLLNRANLIAHETSHMWFGDLVTMKWFDEVWLKEVFANFIADKVTSPQFPEFNQDLLFRLAHYSRAYSVDRTLGANPVTQQLNNLKDAGSLYGNIIYHKAPIVMQMLENKIGAAKLQEGLQQYLKEYSYSNAGWGELIACLDCDGTLNDWSKVWVEEAGRPFIELTKETSSLSIIQSDPQNKNRIWQQPVTIMYGVDDSVGCTTVDLNSNKVTLNDSINANWFYLNGTGTTYGFIKIDSVSQKCLSSNLSKFKNQLIRAAILEDLYENMIEGNMSSSDYMTMLLSNLKTETDGALYEKMVALIASVYMYHLSESDQFKIQQELEQLISFEIKEHQEFGNALISNAIKTFRSEKGIVRLLKMFDKKKFESVTLTKIQLTDLAFVLALYLPEKADEILDQQEARITNRDLKARFNFIRPAVSIIPEIRDSVFNSLMKVENREHEPWVETAVFYLNYPGFANKRLHYIEPGLALLPEIQQTGDIFFPAGWVRSLLAGHRSKEAAEIVKKFLKTNPDFPEPLRLKVLQASDHLIR